MFSTVPNNHPATTFLRFGSNIFLLVGCGLLLVALIAGLHRFANAGLPDPVPRVRGHATPLLEAVAQRDLQSAQQLLRSGSAPDDPEASASPLVQAITSFDGMQMYCNEPMVKLLLQYGANPNRIDPLTSASPLEAAFVRGDKPCVEDLKAANASPTVLNSAGETILASAVVAAARTGNMNMIDLALSFGVSASARDARGMTALHHAIFARSPQVVEALLERGTDPCIPDGNGDTPLEYAMSIRSGAHLPPDLIDVLKRASACNVKKLS